MIDLMLDVLGMLSLGLAIYYCLRHQTAKSLDEASMMPFADDPDVARRVEAATGKPVNAVAPEEPKRGWINMEM